MVAEAISLDVIMYALVAASKYDIVLVPNCLNESFAVSKPVHNRLVRGGLYSCESITQALLHHMTLKTLESGCSTPTNLLWAS